MMNLAELANRKMKFRPSFGLMMRDLLLSREDVVFLVADSARACRFECPESCQDRLVECGIAEQNMIGVAAGLARAGKKPIAFAFSPFACERCFEQVRVDVAYSGLGVVIVGSEGGVGMGTQGVTHYGWEDIAFLARYDGHGSRRSRGVVPLPGKGAGYERTRLHSPERRDSQPRLSQRLRT